MPTRWNGKQWNKNLKLAGKWFTRLLYSLDADFTTLIFGNGSLDLNGTNAYASVADADVFSRGNGTTDSAMSWCGWVNADDLDQFIFLGKGVWASTLEYRVYTYLNKIIFYTADESVDSCYIGRKYDTSVEALEGQDVFLCFTYDGSGTSAGHTISINAVRVDDTNFEDNASSYVAMENLGADVLFGQYNNATFANGRMAHWSFHNKVLTTEEQKQIMFETAARTYQRSSCIEAWALDTAGATLPSVSGTHDATNTNGTLGTAPRLQECINGQVLDRYEAGHKEGSGTVIDTSTGEVSFDNVNNRLKMVGDGASFATTVLKGELIAREFGRALFFTVNQAAATNLGVFGFATTDGATTQHGVYFTSAETISTYAPAINLAIPYSADTDYPCCIILNPFDANGLPWYPGQNPDNYTRGALIYVKISGVWELIRAEPVGSADPLRAYLAQHTGTGYIPDAKIPESLIQVAPALFESATGTGSIDGVNPDYSSTGGVWDVVQGTVEKSGGKLVPTSTSINKNVYVKDVGSADVNISATLTADTAASRFNYIIYRYVDLNNFCSVQFKGSDDEINVYKVVGGSTTEIDSEAFNFVDDTDYDLVVVVNGNSIKTYIDGVLKNDFTDGTQLTATKHGGRFITPSADKSAGNLAADNIIIRPITSTKVTNDFNKIYP